MVSVTGRSRSSGFGRPGAGGSTTPGAKPPPGAARQFGGDIARSASGSEGSSDCCEKF